MSLTELLIPGVIEVQEEVASPPPPDRVRKLKIEAIAALKASIAQKKLELGCIDYTSSRRRLVALNSIPDDQIEDAELEEANRLANEVSFTEETIVALNKEYFTLLALEESLGRPAVDSLRDRHPMLGWLLDAETGVRKAWILHQTKTIRNGQEVEVPFQCRVGRWLSPERKHDREFYVLILYLHGVRAACGEEWVLSERSETPDFVLTCSSGVSRRGAEVSEVPISQNWANAQRAAAVVQPAIHKILLLNRKSICLYSPDWFKLQANLEQVKKLLGKAAVAGTDLVVNSTIGLDAELQPITDGESCIFVSDRKGQTDQDSRKDEQQLAQAIRAAIGKKLVKDGAQRRKPKVRPCDLVLYPNGAQFIDLESVARQVAQVIGTGHKTHFDRIWLSSEHAIVQLV